MYKQCQKEGAIEAAASLHNFSQHLASVDVSLTEIGGSSVAGGCSCCVDGLPKAGGAKPMSYLECWQRKGIQRNELTEFITENEKLLEKSGLVQKLDCDALNTSDTTSEHKWKDFLKNKQCTVYRKQLPSGIYEYRVHASFNDVSARQLLRTNTDVNYRRTWDGYILDLKIVDADAASGNELIHWVTRCPYPFATREYIYLRRHIVDDVSKTMVLLQKATQDTNIPTDASIMRVDTYVSRAIIKPHTDDFDELGCDYMLSYYDDPKMSLPTRMMDLAASRGIQDSTKRMHQATLGLKNYDGL